MAENLSAQKDYLRENKDDLSRAERREYKDEQKKKRRRILVLCLLLNLGILAVVKYTNFFIANYNGIAGAFGAEKPLSFVPIMVPLGISFYTFQALGYLIDVYRETIPAELSLSRYALFVGFFPQLVQGPISRFEDLSATLYGPHPFDSRQFSYGLQRMLWGYFKKMVLADRILVAVSCMTAEPEVYRGAYTLVIMFLYAIEIYADFTGGIDITIGIAQALGITLAENFDRPYFADSLKDYWRRWHISLSVWFRSYVFYPVSISRPMQKLLKFSKKHLGEKAGKRVPVYVSSFIVWFLTGFWHGASWNFILWGLANCLILMVSEELEPCYRKFHERFAFADGKVWHVFCILRTFALLCVLKLFDCYTSVKVLFGMFASVFTAKNWGIFTDGSLLSVGLDGWDYGILGAGCLLLIAVGILQGKKPVRERVAKLAYPARVCVWFGLFLTVLLFGAYGIGYDASQFIYNQF